MRTVYLDDVFTMDESCVGTIGFFDGVHQGHLYLIRRLVEEARATGMASCVITFDRHPRQVLQSNFHPQLLTIFEEKLLQLSQTEVDYCVVIPFTQEVAAFSAKTFMEKVLKKRLHIQKLYIGYDHRFGHNRSEGFEDYVRYGQELSLEIAQNDEYKADSFQHVSSTAIRSYLLHGDVMRANHLLGRSYSLCGKVVDGVHEGRKLGFPTANLEVGNDDKLIPASGVYAVRVHWEGLPHPHLGMMNIGTRPTYGENGQTLEVHIIDYSGNLYGQLVTVVFYKKLRDEHKFAHVKELREQLMIDSQQVIEYFNQKEER